MEPSASSVEKRKRLDIRIEAEPSDERRQAILGVLHREDLSPKSKLNILALGMEDQDPETMEDLHAFASEYGLPFESFSNAEKHQVSAMYRAVQEAKQSESREELTRALDATFNHRMAERALENIDALFDAVGASETHEELKERLTETVNLMGTLAKKVTPEHFENWGLWVSLMERWAAITKLKKGSDGIVQKVIGEVFDENQSLIEDEFVVREIDRLRAAGVPQGIERLTAEMFGRTPEELEQIKERNREHVAAYIMEHAEDAPTIEALEELHRINNDGIVPRSFSRLRKKGEEVDFLMRSGVVSTDVREEMEDFEARATLAAVERRSKKLYEITVAKLHNDLLDIHPFWDRNGSTSMLFMELMMAKKGYKPDPEREKGYYTYVRKVLGNNPIALGIVAHGHWKIAHVPGYYEKGKTTKGKEEEYRSVIEARTGKKMATKKKPKN